MKQLHIRTHKESDLPFIVSSWLKSNRCHPFGKKVDKADYYGVHQHLIKQALALDATWIACNKEDEDQIIGWINFGDNYLNYVFVKEIFEGMGVASALIAQAGLDHNNFIVTHYTNLFHVKHSQKLNIKFNPYLFTNRELCYENQSGALRSGSEMR